jgi:chromosome segregation protein
VQFSRLRLSGFKSFVDPAEFRIEPGLTGVVGPNGCGKSNLLEALRWVMGASSAKAMRGEGMDDVIFAGTGARPSRNHAEVTLTIDNSDRTAPPAFNDHPVLEVTRRIERGEGSSYRVNGGDVRARDVQLLFADASTGANSPALVRQGQISELIAARPQNRRRVLEEAAGVSGLYGRRHEAELRVRAAQTNLQRLDDLAGELAATLARLRREARQAARYKSLAAEIRALRVRLLHTRWAEARLAVERVAEDVGVALRAVEAAARGAAAASTAAIEAAAAIGPLRDEATAAAAVLHHIDIEADRVERALEAAQREVSRLAGDIARLGADAAREDQMSHDADVALERLDRDIEDLEGEIAAAPQRTPQLRQEAEAAEAERARREADVEALASRIAADEARARASAARIAEADGRLAKISGALEQALAERRSQEEVDTSGLTSARGLLTVLGDAIAKARDALEAAEADRARAAREESAARQAARALEDELGGRRAEARGLARIVMGPARARFAPVLDSVSPRRGLEAALAAALGDDLQASLDPAAPSFWSGGPALEPAWPDGATPLAPSISAPPELATRLAFTALVDRRDGPRLQALLPPGARLVSREGDLWRWDGFTVSAAAPRPAQVRLEQITRLAELEAELVEFEPRLTAARAAHADMARALAAAEESARLARIAPRQAEIEAAKARDAVERLERDAARHDARAQSLDETIGRLQGDRREAEAQCAAARADGVALAPDPGLAARLAEARAAAAAAREAAAKAKSALDVEVRVAEARGRRLESLRRDRLDWDRRAKNAAQRRQGLALERGKAEAALAVAREAPGEVRARRERLLDELETARARLAGANDALARAETARADADRAARAAEALAAAAREKRAVAEARLDAARARLAECAAALADATGLDPEAPPASDEDEDGLGDAAAVASVEARLTALERECDAIGAVNLRAEEEAAEFAERLDTLNTEKADLQGALSRLRAAIAELNAEGRERLIAAFEIIDGHFRALFTSLFQGGQAELRLVESDDPLEAGLEIFACPPGKRMAVMSLMSGGEQALTAVALIFAVFLANPAPICVLDEVDAPLDDANVDRFCNLLAEMRSRAPTRFITITHHPLTMSRMDRLYGVTMRERGVSQLVSVDLRQAEAMAAS